MMASVLSERLSERFALNTAPDLVDWLDGGLWHEHSDTLYAIPDDPATLLDAREAGVWSGMLLPDCLPLLGDGCGDRLCLRVAADGSVSEVVSWDHETGEWDTRGATLAEALLYDACDTLSFCERAIDDWQEFARFADWALQWVSVGAGDLAALLRDCRRAGIDPKDALLRAGVAEVAIRRDRCEALVERTPDWTGAAREAEQACRLRRDLAWPHNVLGWDAEQRGDLQGAIAHYADALGTLSTSESFTARWNEGRRCGRGRRVAATRLDVLRAHLPADLAADEYLAASLSQTVKGESYYAPVREHWLGRAAAAERQGAYLDAYRCYYFAGWDHHSGDGEGLLEPLARTAAAAGSRALAAVAELHRQALIAGEERMARMPHARLAVDTAPPRPGGIGSGYEPEERPARMRWRRRR